MHLYSIDSTYILFSLTSYQYVREHFTSIINSYSFLPQSSPLGRFNIAHNTFGQKYYYYNLEAHDTQGINYILLIYLIIPFQFFI